MMEKEAFKGGGGRERPLNVQGDPNRCAPTAGKEQVTEGGLKGKEGCMGNLM